MSFVPEDTKSVDVNSLEFISPKNGPESTDSSLDDELTFSPDLGLSPVTCLSGSMGHLNCADSITPRRRLKLSPDSQNPSPIKPTHQHHAAMETASPTDLIKESSPKPNPQICSISFSSFNPSVFKQKKSRMKLLDLFHSPEHGAGLQRHGSEKARENQCAKEGNDKTGSKRYLPETKRHSISDNSLNINHDENEDDHLIGDFSKTYCLPVEKGKHQDLKYISCVTLAHLLGGAYKDEVQRYHLVDCRYPYEYSGGHIKGAWNIYREEQISEHFLKNPSIPKSRVLLIFYCEFSSERAPKLCRSFRNQDRKANSYPHLYYPELYILKGGYKECYEKFKHLCEPQEYVKMLHRDFRDQLKKYHKKNKPWVVRRTRKELFKSSSPNNKSTVL
ncbi:cdc25-like protein phosphatase twine [Rhinophrynus dorsalis]